MIRTNRSLSIKTAYLCRIFFKNLIDLASVYIITLYWFRCKSMARSVAIVPALNNGKIKAAIPTVFGLYESQINALN